MTMYQNRLQEEIYYLDGLARSFEQKFSNRKSMMFVSGTVYSEEVMIVEFEGKQYFRLMLECTRRRKDSSDIIPVMVPVTDQNRSLQFVEAGTLLTMIGTFRSYDWNDDESKHHLEVFFEAQHFEFSDEMVKEKYDRNIVVLSGYICKEPEIKVSKNGITITEYRISVLNAEGKQEVFPIIAWGSKAVEIFEKNKCGDWVRVLGRLQSRPYHKKTEKKGFVAYEVSSRFTRCYSKENFGKKQDGQPEKLGESAR